MQIKKFICGFCNDKGTPFVSTRKGLRKHLVENHIRGNSLKATWVRGDKEKGILPHFEHPRWWITQEFKDE